MSKYEHVFQSIDILERIYHCHFCIHDYTGEVFSVLPDADQRGIHINAFCSSLKDYDKKFTHTCIAFDRVGVQRQFAVSCEPFFKYCMCRLIEYVQPIKVQKKLVGCIFAGPFLPGENLPEPIIKAGRVVDLPRLNRYREKLEYCSGSILQDLPAFCALLAGEIGRIIEQEKTLSPQEIHNHAAAITGFVNRNFRSDITLSDLAAYLGVCESRVTQILREKVGKTFSVLLNEYRLDNACHLLINSNFNIESVAFNSGFQSTHYFYRVFKKATGKTPVEYRHENAVNL